MKETLLVIDGHSMAFRAFYALPVENFVTAQGQHTNAVFGFASMLIKILEKYQPSHIAVAFDVSRHSFRTDEYPEYKGTRDATPVEFKGQIELIRDLLAAMGIRSLSREGFEADDFLATLAHRGTQADMRVFVVSGDRDSFQTVTDTVTVLYPGLTPGDLREMTPERIEDKYGVPPYRYPEIAALVGEASDNLPGVPGVGPKTAAQWINRFGGLDNLLEHADQVTGKRGEALREHVEDVRRNRRLNHLLTDMDLECELDDLRRDVTDRQALAALCDALEFRSLRSKILAVASIGLGKAEQNEEQSVSQSEVATHEVSVTVANDQTKFSQWRQDHPGNLSLFVDGVLKVNGAEVNTLTFATADEALVIDPTLLTAQQDAELTSLISEDGLIVYDFKGSIHALRARGWELGDPYCDLLLAAYLVNSEHRGYRLSQLFSRYLGIDEEEKKSETTLFDMGITEERAHELGVAAGRMHPLAAILMSKLEESEQTRLLEQLELPIARLLAQMEHYGIGVDEEFLRSLSHELASDVESAQRSAWEVLGHEVNLSSPKQLQTVLFDELNLPKTKKTKTGYTTNAEALTDLFERTGNEFLRHLLVHRDRIKLNQMVDGLNACIGDDQRIHTTFSQTAAATGRLASSDPNLQNIPARSADGLRIRAGFVARRPYVDLMSADYSQIEMRIMAHLSEDQGLIEAFNSGEDLHRTMAAMVFGIDPADVTPEERSRIKATSYGLAYGLSAYGLSAQLQIPVHEASALRDRYFERFGGVRDYLESLVDQARKDGWTQTICGRRRYLPDLHSSNRTRRDMAERAALNAPIQGSAADIVKMAMLDVQNRLDHSELLSRMLVQIHDELLFEVAPGEEEQLRQLVHDGMEGVMKLRVPLEVAIGVGQTWKDAAH
jgi:DNA-directed DNA polymerase